MQKFPNEQPLVPEGGQSAVQAYPQSVYDSLAELRQIAKSATSRNDPRLRYGTADEVLLSQALRKPQHCTGHSARTGLACEAPRIKGANVCVKHGGALRKTKIKAKHRLQEATMPVLNRMIEIATTGDHLPSAVKAGQDVLDRAGVGEVVESKIRSSRKTEEGKINVVIGFLTPQGSSQAVVIDVPRKNESDQ